MKSRTINPEVKASCTTCGAEFGLKLQNKRFPDGIEFSYFVCGKCGKIYVFLVTDADLRKQIKARGFIHSGSDMKLRADELKNKYADRVKELT